MILQKEQDRIFKIIEMAEDGQVGMIEAFVDLQDYVKPLEDALKMIKEFKSNHVDELSMLATDYPLGYGGYTFEFRNGGRTFDFKKCDEWVTYDKAKKECEARLKQAFLSVEKGMMVASEDGEEIQLPEPKYRASSLIVKEIKR